MRVLEPQADQRAASRPARGLRLIRRVSLPAVAALGFSVLAHAAILAAWLLLPEKPEPYFGYEAVFLALLSGSSLLSVAMFVFDDLAALRIMALLRLVLLLGIGSPVDLELAVALPLLLAAELEVCVYDAPPVSTALALALLAGATIAWVGALGRADPAAWVQPLGLQLLAGSMVAVVGTLMTRHRQRSIGLMEEVAQLDKAVSDLSDASRGYLEVADAVQARSTREERDRITRELHDTIGYTFTNLIMMMQAAKALSAVDSGRLTATLEEACAQAQRGLADTRRVLYLLRDHACGDPRGLAGVEHLARTFERATAVRVKVDYANIPARCGEEVESFIYHFVQEGLTNSFRHGKAKNIRIKFWREDGTVRIAVTDDGSGSPELVEGLGLRGMRERLGKLGGTLEARNVSDGFELTAQVPLRAEGP